MMINVLFPFVFIIQKKKKAYGKYFYMGTTFICGKKEEINYPNFQMMLTAIFFFKMFPVKIDLSGISNCTVLGRYYSFAVRPTFM